MYAQVVRVQLQSGKADEAVSIFRESVLPVAQQQQGFRHAYLLIDREADRGMGVSLWETEADVAALASSGFYQEQMAKLADVIAAPPEREVYEVAFEGQGLSARDERGRLSVRPLDR